MRDSLKNRAGFGRVLMTVAATFLTVSATSALAQVNPPRSSAAELAIDAAIPRPEPANLPPPTIDDFKLDTTASVPDTAKPDAPKATEPKTTEKPAEIKPAELDTAPAADTIKNDPTSAGCGHRNAGPRTRQGAGQGRKQRPAGGPASGRQVARNAGREIIALFRPQGRTRRG